MSYMFFSGAILSDARLWRFLTRVDEKEAARCRRDGRPHCGGRLHSAHYPRKPHGLSADLRAEVRRFSFCCSVCRRRVTPSSVRFFGRRFRVAPVSADARPVRLAEGNFHLLALEPQGNRCRRVVFGNRERLADSARRGRNMAATRYQEGLFPPEERLLWRVPVPLTGPAVAAVAFMRRGAHFCSEPRRRSCRCLGLTRAPKVPTCVASHLPSAEGASENSQVADCKVPVPSCHRCRVERAFEAVQGCLGGFSSFWAGDRHGSAEGVALAP